MGQGLNTSGVVPFVWHYTTGRDRPMDKEHCVGMGK